MPSNSNNCLAPLSPPNTQQETFLIRLADLPALMIDRIVAETRNYIVPLIVNDIHLGSGTLVQIDGHYGILTAEHVARPPGRPDLHLDNTSHEGPRLLVPPAEFPGGQPVESFALRIFATDRKTDDHGPDLAFIELPEGPLLRELRARRSFYPLANDAGTKIDDALLDTGFVPFCGFPASQMVGQTPSLGFTDVSMLRGFSFMTGPDRYYEHDTWDYFELGVDRTAVDDIGDSFGGVSGGGVWRIPVYRKKGEPEGKEYFEKVTLAGVAFYEENHLPHGRFFVRAHGPKSIYERLLPILRKRLQPGYSG